MDANPYQSPETSAPKVTAPSDARRKVIAPAIGMIVCSTLGFLYGCSFAVVVVEMGASRLPDYPAENSVFFAAMLGIAILSSILYVAMLFGSVQMLRRRSYRWAMAASIIALLPCSAVTIPSIGFGIWGIVVLRDNRVKAVFRGTDRAVDEKRPNGG